MEVGAHSFVIRRPLPSPLRYGQWLWWDEWNEAKKNHHCHSWLILFVHHSWLGSVPPPLARRNLSSPASDTKNERHEWKTWKQRLGSEPRRERRPTGGSMEWRRWFVSLVPHHLREKRSVGRMGWGTQPLPSFPFTHWLCRRRSFHSRLPTRFSRWRSPSGPWRARNHLQ